jgi:hypothetical protein
MSNRGLITAFTTLVLVLAAACSALGTSDVDPGLNATAQNTSVPVETAEPTCLGDNVSPIGQAIADQYESASYKQIITWFCNGAEFEDILVALETEIQTDTTADEILQMLSEGFTWDDIWLITGLTD